MNQRSDAALVRALLAADDWGALLPPAWITSWQRAPYFDVREDIAASYAGDEDVLNVPVGDAKAGKPLPYDDFVLHPEGLSDNHEFTMFARVVAPQHFARLFPTAAMRDKAWATINDKTKWPAAVNHFTYHAFACVLMTVKRKNGETYIPGPVYVALAGDENGRFVSMNTAVGRWNADAEGRKQSIQLAELAVTTINNTVGYIMRSPKHIVEQRAAAPRCTPKTAKLKPWLRDDLPSLVFMDPDDAIKAGQPRVGGGPEGEGHLRRPHSRRAHWRRLGVDSAGTIRKTFVRSCWVGPDEWEHEGRQYRVLKAADG